jgi:hypothetical protein
MEGGGYMGDLEVDERLFKMDINESECKGIDWMQLAHDRVLWRAT